MQHTVLNEIIGLRTCRIHRLYLILIHFIQLFIKFFVNIAMLYSYIYRITESLKVLGWKGPLEVI